ncbi:MAG: ADP-heptose:LPS heptosyltransferase [Saprospiraceae bacterium]
MPRILIIRFSSIGDIVLTSPVIRCLKLQLGAEIHFLTKKSFAGIFAANPNIDKIHTIEKKVGEVMPILKTLNFDYIIDLHNNIRSRQIRNQLPAKSFSFNKLNIKKWLLVNLKINRLPDIHIVDRYMKAIEKLGVKNDGKGLDYFIPKDTNLPVEISSIPSAFVAFAIGAAHATKRMPTEKIISICQNIKRPIVLLGGPNDAVAGATIEKTAGKHVINLCGKISLHQSALVVQNSEVVITHDTGMMHIAAALKKRIISVWGNTVPEFGMTPYYPNNEDRNTTIEVKNLSCRPCSKIGYATCPKGHFKCMQMIDEEEVRNSAL